MVRPNQEAIDTFISITGAPEAVAISMLEEHAGDLNTAVNAYFSEGDRPTSTIVPVDDAMDIDDPNEVVPNGPVLPFLPSSRTNEQSSLHDRNFHSSFFDGDSGSTHEPMVTHPTEVREVKNSHEPSSHAPVVEDASETAQALGPNSHETVTIDEVGDDSIAQTRWQNDNSNNQHVTPSAPAFDNLPDYGNDIEEQMIRAAIEASKQDAEELSNTGPWHNMSHSEDAVLEEAVSLSFKTAEQEKALREQGYCAGTSEVEASIPPKEHLGNMAVSNGRLMEGSSSIQAEAEDGDEQPLVRHRSRQTSSGPGESANEVGVVEASAPSSPGQQGIEQPLVRHRSRQTSSGPGESANEVGVVEASAPSSPGQQGIGNLPLNNGNEFPSDEWGGISSVEHDEAVMLEAAMFGGIPENGYRFAYAPHHFIRPEGSNPWRTPRPPSPSLEAQRLIREQQDDEYNASLLADREKEFKAIQEAEACRLEEEAARKAALEEEKRKEEESRRKMEEEQECERQLAAKEASLPLEPSADEENAVNLLVRMPDGSRRGRLFLKSDRLQSLYDFIDIGRGVKPGTYRLVRPYPRRAFSDDECSLTLNELGLANKQEALFLELI